MSENCFVFDFNLDNQYLGMEGIRIHENSTLVETGRDLCRVRSLQRCRDLMLKGEEKWSAVVVNIDMYA